MEWKKLKRQAIAVVVLLGFLSSYYNIKATQGSQEIPVSAFYEKDDTFHLKVTVQVGGMVFDGNQKIRDGTVDYSVHLDSEKEFKIVSDYGYRLKSIVYIRPEFFDERELIDKVVNGNLILVAESTLVEVIIQFEKVNEEPEKPIVPDEPIAPDEPVNPSTPIIPDDDIKETITITPNEDETKVMQRVDTGDKNQTYLLAVIGMLISLILFLLISKKEDDENDEHMTR